MIFLPMPYLYAFSLIATSSNFTSLFGKSAPVLIQREV